MFATPAFNKSRVDCAIWFRNASGSMHRAAIPAHASRILSAAIADRAGGLERSCRSCGFVFILSQSLRKQPEGTLESHFESIRNNPFGTIRATLRRTLKPSHPEIRHAHMRHFLGFGALQTQSFSL